MKHHTNAQIAIGLIKGGVFRNRWITELCGSVVSAAAMISQYASGDVVSFQNDWVAVLSDESIVGRTVLRLAGAIDDCAIPYNDISESLIKMIRFCDIEHHGKSDAELGKSLVQHFTTRVPDDVITALCEFIGAECKGGSVSFWEATRFIEPVNAIERDLLRVLLMTADGQKTVSWLCRHLDARPTRTHFLYKIYPSIPFVLRRDNMPTRLLGREPVEDESSKQVETFLGMRHSQCGRRTVLEYRLNEETVESNSFNVRPEIRQFVDGAYTEVNTGVTLKYDINGKDARKFAGVGLCVRKAYPNYANGQSAFIVIDREAGLASVEVGNPFREDFAARIADLEVNGITERHHIPFPKAA